MRNKQYPLVYNDGIQKYLAQKRTAYHMPGHKGRFVNDGIADMILPADMMPLDITASYEREDLYNPQSFLKQSLENAREIYGTLATHYLVNGSTGGNQAALIATLKPGDKILMPRNVHKLIYGALVATQAIPVYLPYGSLAHHSPPLLSGIDPTVLETMLKQDPDIKVVYFVNPSYTGVCSDIVNIIQIAHQHNKIVIVDEAHGAHFLFHPELPISAITAGADIVIQSAHKTLNALSQTALLHVCSDRVDKARVELSIGMFQTTSPNTILLLSLESAVVQMANQGQALWDMTLNHARDIREMVLPFGFHCYDQAQLHQHHVAAVDITKLYMDVTSTSLMGYEVKSILGKEFQVEAELADDQHILLSLTIADTKEDIRQLKMALTRLGSRTQETKSTHGTTKPMPNLSTTPALTPAEAFFAEQEDISLIGSMGRICAEMITPYPPGIPILMPGERISAEIIEYIQYLINAKASFAGSRYKDLSYLRVIR